MALTFLTNEDLGRCLTGSGAPTTATVGAVGALYMDTGTGKLYKCTAVADGAHTWALAESSNNMSPNANQVEPADDDLPRMFFTLDGWLPTTKDAGKVKCLMRYVSKTADISRPVTMGVQGSSSVARADYKKKNYTMVPYKDDTYEDKDKLAFKDWPAMNKFVLKASWVTPSHIRNPGTAEIAGQVVRSRADYDTLPEELRNSPNQGATNGFAVRVWVNGIYWGIYELIVAKDKLFGQDKDNAAHSIVGTEWNNQASCAFATTTPTISGNWSEELQDEMSADTEASLTDFISFVAGSTDEEFVANAENYFDVQSVIDVDIMFRLFCVVDNLCRNQIFFKYDKKWYEGFWDLDAVLGLPPVSGQSWYAYNTAFQEGYVAYKDYGVTNLLYQRVEECFLERFKARYWELRGGVLSIANVLNVYERRMDVLKSYDGLLAEDYAATTGNGEFTAMPNTTTDTIQQIRQFVHDRWAYMDEVVAAIGTEDDGGDSGEGDDSGTETEVACTGITLNKSTLTFTAEGTQTLTATVTPDGCTDPITWESDNTSVATVSGGVVTAIANGSANITAKCGGYSANCAVAVSFVEVDENWERVELTEDFQVGKYINGNTGALTVGSTRLAAYDSFVPVVAGMQCVFAFAPDITISVQVAYFDSEQTALAKYKEVSLNEVFFVPDNAAYIKFHLNAGSNTFTAVSGAEVGLYKVS